MSEEDLTKDPKPYWQSHEIPKQQFVFFMLRDPSEQKILILDKKDSVETYLPSVPFNPLHIGSFEDFVLDELQKMFKKENRIYRERVEIYHPFRSVFDRKSRLLNVVQLDLKDNSMESFILGNKYSGYTFRGNEVLGQMGKNESNGKAYRFNGRDYEVLTRYFLNDLMLREM